MTKIIHVKVTNIMGIAEAEFAPTDLGATIGGGNGSGKTSLIQALKMTTGGKSNMPPIPVRQGADRGKVELLLESGGETFKATLDVKEDRTSTLLLASADGSKRFQRPAETLQKLFGSLSFDPGRFKKLAAAERVRLLLDAVGLDLRKSFTDETNLRDRRREAGQDLRRAEAAYLEMPGDSEEIEHVDVAELSAELEELSRGSIEVDSYLKSVEDARIEISSTESKLVDLKNEVEAFAKSADEELAEVDAINEKRSLLSRHDIELRELQKRHAREVADLDDAQRLASARRVEDRAKHLLRLDRDQEMLNSRLARLKNHIEAAPKVEAQKLENDARREALLEKIRSAEEINAKHRQQVAKLEAQKKRDALAVAHAELEAALHKLLKDRAELLASVDLPVPGLTFSDSEIFHEGIPFEQLNESRQWEICTGLAFKLKPSAIVFLSESAGLDKKSRARVRETAAALGVQFFLEVVDDADDVQILVSNGKIQEDRIAGNLASE